MRYASLRLCVSVLCLLLSLDCPFVDACIGVGNHHYFVSFLMLMLVVMPLYCWVAIRFLMVPDNRTLINFGELKRKASREQADRERCWK